MTESQAIDALVRAINIPPPKPSVEFLAGCLGAFRQINYENVTKIIRAREVGANGLLLRTPEILVSDHLEYGAGGTCFSLTWLLYRTLRYFDIPARLATGDRTYGENTHTAVISTVDNVDWLLDVGYLIFYPVHMSSDETTSVQTELNTFEITPVECGFEAHTVFRGQRKYRFTLRNRSVTESEFLELWKQSFSFQMMQYPLVTRLINDRQHYLQGNTFQIRSAETTEKTTLDPSEIPDVVHTHFGLSQELTKRAIALTTTPS